MMADLLQSSENPWLVPLLLVVVALLIFVVVKLVRGRAGSLEQALADISYDRIEALIVPNADEGEILVDYLLLTSQGLLILEIKDVQGTVFGGDKLKDWSVISNEGRFTFSNPQHALYDRIAAVRQIVREVPVAGRILFMDGAQFTKGTPDLVSNIADLVREFGETDKNAAKFKVEAFKPHWEKIRKEALSTGH